MKFIKFLIVGIFAVIYIPLNALLMWIQKWYLPMYAKDKVIYFAFAPIYWTYFVIVAIISFPYEKLTENLH